MLRSRPVAIGNKLRGRRIALAASLLLVMSAPLLGQASGAESISDLRARMSATQARIDDSTAQIEELEDVLERADHRIGEIEDRVKVLEKQDDALEEEVIERAKTLYMTGRSEMLEALFGAKTIAELSDAAEMLSQVSLDDSGVFIKLARSRAELVKLEEELVGERKELKDSYEELKAEHERQQALFDSIASDYESLQDQSSPAAPSAPTAARVRGSGGMFCPVAGPTSFVDSWGAPRSGHTHVGVDMMAGYGTPLVAIVSGTITYAAYDGSGGNMIFLSGDDGNAYWYMHNQTNLVSGGRVTAGQQIATVGDTGNAAGTPHLHFEYHPGGGGPVNPYPLVASIC